jgi:hypothetical protein
MTNGFEAQRSRGVTTPGSTGGSFAPMTHSAPEVGFRPDSEVYRAKKGTTSGQWNIETSNMNGAIVKDGWSTTTVHVGGAPWLNNRHGAAARLVSEDTRDAVRQEVRDLSLAGEKMTLLIEDSGTVRALETSGGGPAGPAAEPILWVKGSKRSYYLLDKLNILAVQKGYGKQDAIAAEFDKLAEQTPVTEKSTWDELPLFDGDGSRSDHIAAVYMIDGPDFGNGKEPGCLFFATDLQPEDEDRPESGGIINGYFWAPSDAGLLTSESGSFYTRDIRSKSGRVRDYKADSLTYRDAMKFPTDRAAGYRALIER